jgi:hypothetical protein
VGRRESAYRCTAACAELPFRGGWRRGGSDRDLLQGTLIHGAALRRYGGPLLGRASASPASPWASRPLVQFEPVPAQRIEPCVAGSRGRECWRDLRCRARAAFTGLAVAVVPARAIRARPHAEGAARGRRKDSAFSAPAFRAGPLRAARRGRRLLHLLGAEHRFVHSGKIPCGESSHSSPGARGRACRRERGTARGARPGPPFRAFVQRGRRRRSQAGARSAVARQRPLCRFPTIKTTE